MGGRRSKTKPKDINGVDESISCDNNNNDNNNSANETTSASSVTSSKDVDFAKDVVSGRLSQGGRAIEALSSLFPDQSRWYTGTWPKALKATSIKPAISRQSSITTPEGRSKSPMERLLSGATTTTGPVSLGNESELNTSAKKQTSESDTGAGNKATNGYVGTGQGSSKDKAVADTSQNTNKSEPTTYTSYVFSWFSKQEQHSGEQISEQQPPILTSTMTKDDSAIKVAKDTSTSPRPSSSPTIVTSPTTTSGNILSGGGVELGSARPTSWFYFWPGAEGAPGNADNKDSDESAETLQKTQESQNKSAIVAETSKPTVIPPSVVEPPPRPLSASSVPMKSAGWSFWSKPQTMSTDAIDSISNSNEGTAGTISAAPGTTSSAKEPVKPPLPDDKNTKERAKNITAQQQKSTTQTIVPQLPPRPGPATKDKKETAKELGTSSEAGPSKASQIKYALKTDSEPVTSASQAKLQVQQKLQTSLPPNLLVPSFESCFGSSLGYGIFNSITKYFKPTKTPREQLNLVYRPRIKKAVAIGVHGFFPMKLLQHVLGEPTGTSTRFATAGAAAIQRWAEKHGMNVDITRIALEGEGKVEDRIEILWRSLGKHLGAVRDADFVLVACHSQGTPVGVQLVARLVEQGWVDRPKIGIIGMAGVNLGPYPQLNSRILTGSAKELFDFTNPESRVSKKYLDSIRTVIAHGVKILYVGSIDDQLVPLESAIYSNINHPFIYRACFVDGRIHAPDFISHLISLALRLRNVGVSDHNIIRELSAPLAGSLYSGEGHSRIYDDTIVYDLALRHSLETSTTDFLNVPLKVESPLPQGGSNPFFLPWAMRGILEEKIVRDELFEEAEELLQQFDNWRPSTKVLKDVKYRLDAIKSKL